MEAFPDSGRMINGCPGTGTTWGHGRRRADGTVEITAEDMEHYHRQGFIILRQAFTKERMAGLLSAVRRMVAKGVAQHEAMAALKTAAACARSAVNALQSTMTTHCRPHDR